MASITYVMVSIAKSNFGFNGCTRWNLSIYRKNTNMKKYIDLVVFSTLFHQNSFFFFLNCFPMGVRANLIAHKVSSHQGKSVFKLSVFLLLSFLLS